MTHLLVTNDFPPKVGGIQNYLWELWRRLPPDEVVVLTTDHAGAAEFDRQQPFRVERLGRVLLPTPAMVRRIDALAEEVGAGLVVLDPAVPLGFAGPRLARPYGVLVHGAEVTVPGRVPGPRHALAWVLRGAQIVIANSDYPAVEAARVAGRPLPAHTIYPGVDWHRFHPLDDEERVEVRRRLGVPIEGRIVLGVSRLVPRKGFDVLLQAAGQLAADRRDLTVAIAGTGRDRGRLERIARRAAAPVTFLGRVADDDLPALYASADVFAMLARNRWGGLEQEGLGIVFLEAAAAGVPQVAGRSGGVAEAVAHGVSGLVVDDPSDVGAVAAALARLLDDPTRREQLGRAARCRIVQEFDLDALAARLRGLLAGAV